MNKIRSDSFISVARQWVMLLFSVTIIITGLVMVTTVNVNASVSISNRSKTINSGSTFVLKLNGTSSKVTWQTANKKIARVTKKGKVTGYNAGTTKITATANGRRYTCKVRVQPVINRETYLIWNGGNVYLSVKGATGTVKWSSADNSIATVSNSGKVTTLKTGTVTIKAIYKGKAYKSKITIWDADEEDNIKAIKEVFAKTNEARVKNGKSKLKLNYKLCKAAETRSKEISGDISNFTHTRPNGKSCFTVFTDFGFEVNSYKGENIAYGYVNPTKVMAGWMGSDGHRDNILNSNYEEIGIAMYNLDGMRYWVQEFYGL